MTPDPSVQMSLSITPPPLILLLLPPLLLAPEEGVLVELTLALVVVMYHVAWYGRSMAGMELKE